MNATETKYSPKVNKHSDVHHKVLIGRPYEEPPTNKVRHWYDSWEQFGLADKSDANQSVDIPLPSWFTRYEDLLDSACIPYLEPLAKLRQMMDWKPELTLPTNFRVQPGWQYWKAEIEKWVPCKPPSNRVMVLDFEAIEVAGKWYPSVAIARLEKGWLCWCNDFSNMSTTATFGKNNLVAGHNISYDRQYLDVEYLQASSGNLFHCTMSSWIVTRGISNQQRPVYKMAQKARENGDYFHTGWDTETAMASLDEVYKFYFQQELDKSVRSQIVDGGYTYTVNNLQEVTKYCLLDVIATLKVHQRLYPEYCQHRPSVVSRAGALRLGSVWLPLSTTRFPGFYDKVETEYQKILSEVRVEIRKAIDIFLKQALEKYPLTEGMYSRDTDVRAKAHLKYQEQLPGEWLSVLDDWLPALSGKAKGLPKWYRDIKFNELSIHQRVVAIVLGLKWHGQPVWWALDYDDLDKKGKPKGGWATSDGWIEHPDEPTQKVTDLFIKGFSSAVEDGVLTASLDGLDVASLLSKVSSTINWVSMRKRVNGIHTEAPEGYPVTIPQLVPNGTITGRCTDSLWQVLPNPKAKRLGTELKSMVEAPEGKVIVGADVDGQEADICGWLGDKVAGYCGATPMGLINIIGRKKDKTDIHNIMATKLNMLRDQVKNLVYGVIYGLGRSGASSAIRKATLQANDICLSIADEFLRLFKGTKVNGRYSGGLASQSFNVMEAIADSKQPKTPVLKNLLTRSLAGKKDYKTTRVNWVIQSSGVDFRDILILLTEYFYSKLGIDGRLLITIHDEVRTMVSTKHKYLAAYALQLAHLVTRMMFVEELGLNGLPARMAWFSAVDICGYLAKEPVTEDRTNDNCKTPTQPEGLADGELVTATDLLKMFNDGTLELAS